MNSTGAADGRFSVAVTHRLSPREFNRYPTAMRPRVNPYNPPETDLVTTASGVPKRKSNLRSLLIPSFLGAVVGSFMLAPITRGPGDPTGHGIAFGLGGIISLFAAITVRALKRQLQP